MNSSFHAFQEAAWICWSSDSIRVVDNIPWLRPRIASLNHTMNHPRMSEVAWICPVHSHSRPWHKEVTSMTILYKIPRAALKLWLNFRSGQNHIYYIHHELCKRQHLWNLQWQTTNAHPQPSEEVPCSRFLQLLCTRCKMLQQRMSVETCWTK